MPLLKFTAPHAGIAVHNHPPGGRHISTEIWQRLSSLFPFSRAFSAFPSFPHFFANSHKSLCRGESGKQILSIIEVFDELDEKILLDTESSEFQIFSFNDLLPNEYSDSSLLTEVPEYDFI